MLVDVDDSLPTNDRLWAGCYVEPMHDHVTVERLTEITAADSAAIAALLPQLSTTATFDPTRLDQLVAREDIEMFVARVDGQLVGMATLVTFPLPTGWRGLVEDVVVDAEARGAGIARLLLEALTSAADRLRLRTLDLTSRGSREAALRLYESVGFVRRDTNVMRYSPVSDRYR